MSDRQILFLAGLPAALLAAALLLAASPPVSIHSTLNVRRSMINVPLTLSEHPNSCYAIRLSESNCHFDLTFDADTPYDLIVSSLGDAAETFHVQLDAQPIDHVECCRTIPITPLANKKPAFDKSHFPTTRSQARLGARDNRQGAVADSVESPDSTFDQCTGNGMQSLRAGVPRRSLGSSDFPAASERRFFLHVAATPLEDPSGYVAITARPVAEGTNVRIYVDSEVPVAGLAPGLTTEVIRLLDDEIIPRSREILGEHADVDGDGKLAVLVTRCLGRMCGGRTSLNGCVRANDFQPGVEAPFGNSADLLYLNSSLRPDPALATLLAHEYTHAVCFSRRFLRETGVLPLEDDWLNEAIAHVAEQLHGAGWSNLDERISQFLALPGNAPLVVTDYYRTGLWRDPGCRGATYLFLQFCVDHFGPGLLRELVESPLTGPRNLEEATGLSFPVLFRHWTIALANDEIPSVPLCSTLGSQQLSGASRTIWRIDDAQCTFELRGTSANLVRMAPAKAGARRITVKHAPAGRLQMTLIRRNASEH